MVNPLLLHTNNDIPFVAGRCAIHNPTIKEISLIGEEDFQKGVRFLNFNKNNLDEKDKIHLSDKSDFEILIEIMKSKEYYTTFTSKSLLALSLLFPLCEVQLKEDSIQLTNKENGFITKIDKNSYEEFKQIIIEIFVLESNDEEGNGNYNPADGLAAKIAQKIKDGQKKRGKQKDAENILKKKSIYGKMVSVLSVGLGKDKNELLNYTIYQLLDEYKRFQLKNAYDINIKARLAGATDIDDPEDWLEDLLL